jgi:hypothetical protein
MSAVLCTPLWQLRHELSSSNRKYHWTWKFTWKLNDSVTFETKNFWQVVAIIGRLLLQINNCSVVVLSTIQFLRSNFSKTETVSVDWWIYTHCLQLYLLILAPNKLELLLVTSRQQCHVIRGLCFHGIICSKTRDCQNSWARKVT